MSDYVEIAKAFAGSYPLAGAVTVIACAYVLREHVGPALVGLFNRTTEIGPAGLKATAPPQDAKAVDEIKASAAEVFERMFPNEMLWEREGNVRSVLDGQQLRDGAEREKYLVRMVAVAGTIIQFEATYRGIYGSQLAALTALNASPMEPALLQPIYDFAKPREPALFPDWMTFEQWLSFLVGQRLAVYMPDGKLSITIEGREFLKFITGQGYPTAKPG